MSGPLRWVRYALFRLLQQCLIGAGHLSPAVLLSAQGREQALQVLAISRIPRTVALILAGTAMAVASLIMRILTQNRFVEPSTAGTVESASLGLLFAALFGPDLPVIGKMLVASVFALAGTAPFPRILRLLPLRSVVTVPLGCSVTAVSVSQPLLPWGLGFAAGAMLFVIGNEIIPETHRFGHETAATGGLMFGVVTMTFLDTALG